MKQETETSRPHRLAENEIIEGTQFVCTIPFSNNEKIPMYEAITMHGFNQLLGKAKFDNREYGTVFYRGQNELYDNLIPSLFRGNCKVPHADNKISLKIKEIINDDRLYKDLKLKTNAKEKVEAVMQHYGCKTRFLDIVDNHWIALWMGLHALSKQKRVQTYYRYIPRLCSNLDCVPMLENNVTRHLEIAIQQKIPVAIKDENYKNAYLFVLLIAAPTMGGGKKARNEEGIIENNGVILADLRRCLPSVFLRPHAQHALVLKKKGNSAEGKEAFDLSNNIVGIICVRLDRAADWLGNGKFLTQDNLFPPSMFDFGYDILLSRTDIFNTERFQIAKFV